MIRFNTSSSVSVFSMTVPSSYDDVLLKHIGIGMIKTSYNVLVLDLRVDTADIRLLLLFIT